MTHNSRISPASDRDGNALRGQVTALSAGLLQIEARLRNVLSASPDTIIIVDGASRILLAGGRVRTMFGYAPEELVGADAGMLLPERNRKAHSDHLQHYLQDPDARIGAGRNLYGRRKDGTEFPVEVSLTPDRSARSISVIVAVRDITDRRAIETQLGNARKMEAIGSLTGGMAHDFNNLLGIIIGNLDLLGEQLGADPEATALTGEAIEAALRGAEMTQRLLAFARRQQLAPTPTALNALVGRVCTLRAAELGDHAETRLDLDDATWPVIADPAQLEASLVNILDNARDAMPEGGTLMIATSNRVLDQDYASRHPGVAPGDYALIEVSDTGEGIAPELMEKIFEPFFTTREQGKGSGLGLSMVFGFAKQSGGHINVSTASSASAPPSASICRAR